MSTSSIDDISSYLPTNTGVTQLQSSSAMTYNDFLSLLTAELQNQDPTDPVDNKQMVLQLAQFSTLSATSALNSNMSSFISTSTISTLNGMIGKNVTYSVTSTDSSGTETTSDVTGTVKGINIATDGNVTLNVDGTSVNTSQLTSVNQATTTTTSN